MDEQDLAIYWRHRVGDWLAGYFQRAFREGKKVEISRSTIEKAWIDYATIQAEDSEDEAMARRAFDNTFALVALAYGKPESGKEN